MRLLLLLFGRAFALLAVAVMPCNAAAELDASRFCIAPVEADPSEPIYTTFGLAKWRIIADRRLIRYPERFPRIYLDDWAVEPWSSRVVAARWSGGISVWNAGDDVFREIDTTAASWRFSFEGPFVLPSREQTIVIADGLPFIVEEDHLRPWMNRDELARAGIDGLYNVYDAPSLGALLILARDKRLFVLADDQWHLVDALHDEEFGTAIDFPTISTVVFLGNRSVVGIRRSGSSFEAQSIATSRHRAASSFHHSEIFGQLLHYGPAGFFDRTPRWQRVTAGGLEDIPGGQINTPAPNGFVAGHVYDVDAPRAVVIVAEDGLHLYDGDRIRPLQGAGTARLGQFPTIADLQGIGRTLVSSTGGLFEITPDGVLLELEMPFRTSGLPTVRVSDWPEAGVALLTVDSATYILGPDLDVVPFSDIGAEWSGQTAGALARTGDKVLVGKSGLLLAIDTRQAGRKICDGNTD